MLSSPRVGDGSATSPLNHLLSPRPAQFVHPSVVREAFLAQQEAEQEQMQRDIGAFEQNLSRLQQLTPRLNDASRRYIALVPPQGSSAAAATSWEGTLSDTQLNEVFRLIDRSRNGLISPTDFMKACRSQPPVLATIGLTLSAVSTALQKMNQDNSKEFPGTMDLIQFKGFVNRLLALQVRA